MGYLVSNLRLVFAVSRAMTMYIERQIFRMVVGFQQIAMAMRPMAGLLGIHYGTAQNIQNSETMYPEITYTRIQSSDPSNILEGRITSRWSRPGMRGEKTYPAPSLAAQLETVRRSIIMSCNKGERNAIFAGERPRI